MGAYTDRIVAEGTKVYALVELDDYNTTLSTGGIVIDIYWILPGADKLTPWEDDYNWSSGNFKAIDITESEVEVEKGWILQDKTNVLRHPNS